MVSVCLYFKVHQPYRFKKYQPQDINVSHCYADPAADREAINLIADNCYGPANAIIHQLINENNKKFRVAYSISGTTLELFQRYRPDMIQSFKELVDTGQVEILAETFYHSLSSLYSPAEFHRQVNKHAQLVKELFNTDTTVFRNTELIYSNQLAEQVAGMGFKGILCEGVERILQGRSPNQLYSAPAFSDCNDFGLLLRNTNLSDDIAFRFDDVSWSAHPLTADKFGEWLHAHPADTEVINLFMDYETFGIHKKESSGIFDFLRALPAAVLNNGNFIFSTPAEVLDNLYPKDSYDVIRPISWEDRSEASCVWTENVMQHNTLKKIYSLEKIVMDSGCEKAIGKWGRLQSADHFYYMVDGNGRNDPHKYKNPFLTAEDAFQNYINIITDFEIELITKGLDHVKKHASLRAAFAYIF